MRKLTTMIAVLLTAGFIQAQTAERSVISSSGGSYSGPALQVDYTVGEMTVATLNNAGNILTQGFQQPDYLLTDAENISETDMDISYYPNPCTDQLNIRFNNPEESSLKAELFDVMGRQILSKDFAVSSHVPSTLTFDLSGVATGTYYVRIAADKNQVSNFKVIKINY